MALQELRGNKVRAMLTMLGVIIGSACIVLVVTVALVGKRYVVGQIEGVGVNMIHAELVHTGDTQRTTLGDEITLADLEAAQATLPHVEVAAGSHDMPMTFVVNGVSRPVSMVGVTEGFQTIRRFLILDGRYLDQDDFNSHSKVCVISRELAELAFPNEDPLGKDIRLGDLHFNVIGVFHERTATFGLTEVTKYSVIVPIGLIKYYTGEEYLRTLYVQADRPENVPELTKQVGQLLSSRHRRGAEYLAENLDSLLDSARRISLALTVLLIVVATIALTISGIGIMNIMLVTVTERTREIGIRKAIGAQRKEILYQFLIEAVLISGVGALIGIAIAVAIPFAIEALVQFLPVPGGIVIPISWLSVAAAFIVSCATGVLFGYLPAKKAASLQPVESLRYE